VNLLPSPRILRRAPGFLRLPKVAALHLDDGLPAEVAKSVAERLVSATREAGVRLESSGGRSITLGIHAKFSASAPKQAEGYKLRISSAGVFIEYRDVAGLRAAVATLRQLFREYGARLPRLTILDYPDFPRRGVMLDISRGRVPKLETLLEVVDHLADFKINEFQLYVEHTFAYRRYGPVWQEWGAITAAEIRRLDKRCRELGIDLVPNQNSFGHLRQWLEYPPLHKLAEVAEPYEAPGGAFLRRPSTLAPNAPGTLPFLRGLFDELLPNFSSRFFNVGCDETWDLGRGRSKALCQRVGQGRVYLDFLKRIQREVSRRKRTMMFWGDIILHHPHLIKELPADCVALNWGYEAAHPFTREARLFGKSGVPFQVCPGTSTWMTLVGRHDNALANLRSAAAAGRAHGAGGYLITDWGDGGHPQPLAVSYLPYLAGASLAWCAKTFDAARLAPVLSRDVFADGSGHAAAAAFGLGLAHQELRYKEANLTPLGAVIAAPPPEWRELFCRDGLKYYARITPRNIRAALAEVEAQRKRLARAKPRTATAKMLVRELDLAARMAAQSCRFMRWQQARATGRDATATKMAKRGAAELRKLENDFNRYWPLRNKGDTGKCSPFLRWRRDDYRFGRWHGLVKATTPAT
jgi:hexosaminidase